MNEMLKLWIHNTSISNLHKKYIYNTFKSFDQLFYEVFNAKKSKLTDTHIGKFKNTYEQIESILSHLKNNEIGLVTIDDDNYPRDLLNYSDCPFGLCYKGDISVINKKRNLSVVGSRRCTRYGLDVTNYIVGNLKGCNINIVSGLAKGIDTASHKSAIVNGLTTVGILGSGIDIIYPKENKKLYEDIVSSGGCILSEFPVGTKPLSYNFPIRNRIISGIGHVILIVEGGEKSGTLITARTALDQGKDIVVVPGSIFSLESKGTNKLIRDGAIPFVDMEDILDLLNISAITINNNKEENIRSPLENKLIEIIDDNPIHIDNIIKLTHIDINQLYKLLFELQVKKEILCLSGNFYVRINKMNNSK